MAKARETAQYDPRSGNPNKSLEEVLDRYVITATGCHEWTGTRNEGEYGIVCLMLDGKPNTMPAPRLQWMRLKGKPADGMDILHTCDYPPCINIEHLFEGTPKTNIHDMIRKGRHNFTGLKYSGGLGTGFGTEEARPMTASHPISTAPKDGTQILGYGRYAWGGNWSWPDFSRGKVGWAVIFWEEMEDGVYTPLPDGGYPDGEPDALGVWRLANANLYVDWMDATHWLPLPPDPPKDVP